MIDHRELGNGHKVMNLCVRARSSRSEKKGRKVGETSSLLCPLFLFFSLFLERVIMMKLMHSISGI